jgi:lysozyme
MVALTEDVSRAQLFSRFIKPRLNPRALPRFFAFPQDTRFEGPNKPRIDSIFGVDISHYNESRCKCKIDWSSFQQQNVAFAYLKATQGARFYDNTFERNWGAIAKLPKERSLYRGAYHFLSADVDASAQAKHFLRVLPKLDPADMAPSLDLEWDMRKNSEGSSIDAWSRVDKAEIAERALIWLREVKKVTGKTPIIYTNRAWWAQRIGEERAVAFAEFPIWIADYSASRLATEKPGVMTDVNWTLWQFSEDAKLNINGSSSQVDANIFRGSLDTLKTKLSITE